MTQSKGVVVAIDSSGVTLRRPAEADRGVEVRQVPDLRRPGRERGTVAASLLLAAGGVPAQVLAWPYPSVVRSDAVADVHGAHGDSIREVLAAWRAAERELDEIPASNPEWVHAQTRLISLRTCYHRLVQERSAARWS